MNGGATSFEENVEASCTMGSLKMSSVAGAACESSGVDVTADTGSLGGTEVRAGTSAAVVAGDVAAGIGANMDAWVSAGRGIGVGAWIGAGVEVRAGLMGLSTASVVGGGVGASIGDVGCGLFLFEGCPFVCGRLGPPFGGGGRELSAGAGVFDVG